MNMMANSIIKLLREIWESWDVPLFVMLSLFLQLFLIWFASLRKRVSHQILYISIWMAYLLADWVAAFTIGLIHYKAGNTNLSDQGSPLYSFWAPFLVVHLGGPDTITAFSMEDNELWRRHLLRFVAQTFATGNILYQIPPPAAILWVPTALVFLCGLMKYGERVWALYRASMDKFRRSILREPDPGPNYAMFVGEYAQKLDADFPTRIMTIDEPELEQDLHNFEVRQHGRLQGPQVVKDAYRFYQRFKGLIVDFEYGFRDRNKSAQYFLSLEEDDAFRVVETELNFIYEAFYTKAVILHRKTAYVTRSICLCFMLISLGVFFLWEKVQHQAKKHHISPKHVRISYTLLFGAIALDIISLLVIIFSNWSVAFLVKDYSRAKDQRKNIFNRKSSVVDRVLAFKSRWLSPYPEAPQASQVLFQTWSQCVCRFSLLNYYLQQRHPKVNMVLDTLGLRLLLDGLTYVNTYRFNVNMRRLILQELKKKSELVNTPNKAKELCSARGIWVLNSFGIKEVSELCIWIKSVEYDEGLLLWHIATEVCYNTDRIHYDEERSMSKALSDYMVYLLVMKPMMISNVAGISDLRLLDTEAEALRFIRGGALLRDDFEVPPLDLLCRRMMSMVINDVSPRDVKGTRSKSVLFEACRLANRLLKLPKEVNMWHVMSRVWVEFLCYAASHCRPTSHVEQLSKGGELITVVWLLMVHLGLGKQFHDEDGTQRTKLIVDD